MADAIVSVVVEQLASFALQEVKLVVSVRKDVNDLTSTLQMLQAVLRDAETRQIKEEAVKLWLDKLKDIVYDAEDVLDEWNVRNHNSMIQKVGDDGVRLHKKVLSYLLPPCILIGSVVTRYDIGSRIKEIRECLDKVAADEKNFKFSQAQIHEEPRLRLTSSIIDVSNTYGRDHDKNVIVSFLGESNVHVMNTDVISIVGTGGFGKTTLAKLVLEEPDVKNAFEKRIFVCVSEPFDLLKVAKAIVEEATGNVPTANGWEALHKCLCDSLKGKRFLLVLDDVWTEDSNDWTPLQLSMDGGAPGSKVIVTTRNEKVAEMMGSKHIHNLAKLSDNDSWLIFKHIAFAGRQEEVSKFEDIGKEISIQCKGVPLVVKTIGSLMRHIKTKNEWNNVLASELWEIKQIEKEILPSLFLSYNPLPSNLKQCFMYCAIFPKDTEIDTDSLVKLWMAQGFLGSGGNRDLEKIGYDYFEDLAMRSFFQDFEKGPAGNITSSKMHDLVHDFAQFLTKGELSILEVGKELVGKKVRHVVTARVESSSIYMAENLRTLKITKSVNPAQLIKIFNQLKCIRTLDLSDCDITELPSEVNKLLHLRYLDLSDTKLVELPETICDLYNLQTLKLNSCGNLIKLPSRIGTLLNLRHLELKYTYNLRCLPRGIGRLTCLRTLSKFIVGDASNGCNIRDLKDLCYLHGSLEIIGLKWVADANEAAQAELKNKSIVALSLEFESSEVEEDSENMVGVLENLQPHENVEELDIYNFGGSQFPSWIPKMSANLLRLTLSRCHHTINLPALGNLTSLEELIIGRMKSVKQIGCEFYGELGVAFPKLKILVINDMEELVELEFPVSTDRTIMPCLQKLSLRNCRMLRALPPGLGKLESLEILEIKELPQVKHIGEEFYGFDDGDTSNNPGVMAVAFPQLKVLKVTDMNELVDWEFLISARDNKKIMPCLSTLELSDCPMLRALPCLGTLETLESLVIGSLPLIKQVDLEFWGLSAAAADEFGGCSIEEERVINDGGEGEEAIRTTLRNLWNSFFSRIKRLSVEFWGLSADEFGGSSILQERVNGTFPSCSLTNLNVYCMKELEDLKFPPDIRVLEVDDCPKLRALPDLARFKSLEILNLNGLESLEESVWEEREEDISLSCLRELTLSTCPNLRVIPRYLFPHTLRNLVISNCQQLNGVQPCFPPLLESLNLWGNVGVFNESLPIGEQENNNYPNLIFIEIVSSEHLSLPKGLNHLTAIQELDIYLCESLDFDLNELKHLTMLQNLNIIECPILSKRFESSSGADWMSILSHVLTIKIDNVYIKGSWGAKQASNLNIKQRRRGLDEHPISCSKN